MNRSKQRVAQLASIRHLRALSEQVAEARAVQWGRASREQEARCRQEENLLDAALNGWRAALAEPRFDPMRASLHGQAVDRQERARAQSFEELAGLTARLDKARREFSRAQAGHRCADELLKRAERRHLRLREEKITASRDDDNANRGAAP
jgi:hypothetical protein